MLSLRLPFANGDAEAADADGFAPNAFIRVESDGQIVLTKPYVEMGQGTYTSIPMLIAEELEVDLKQLRLEHAPPNEKLYGNPLIGGVQATGDSNAIRAAWQPLRQAGAIARTMLVSAAHEASRRRNHRSGAPYRCPGQQCGRDVRHPQAHRGWAQFTFALNHMAYFVVTQGLRERLVASVPARVVSTASAAHQGASLEFDDMQLTESFGAMKAYGRSKLCNILFTRELARRLHGTGVTANCLHPGRPGHAARRRD